MEDGTETHEPETHISNHIIIIVSASAVRRLAVISVDFLKVSGRRHFNFLSGSLEPRGVRLSPSVAYQESFSGSGGYRFRDAVR
jgi:hypothetical protein